MTYGAIRALVGRLVHDHPEGEKAASTETDVTTSPAGPGGAPPVDDAPAHAAAAVAEARFLAALYEAGRRVLP